MANTAKQEILDFLASKEAGIKSSFKKSTLDNAAANMYIANGLSSPVAAIERDGETYLINREIISNGVV